MKTGLSSLSLAATYRRQLLEQWVEWAIDVLDHMDGEPDLEVDDEHDETEHEAPGLIRGGRDWPMTEQSLPRPLSEIKANECKWPVNDAVEGEQHLFCGHPVKASQPYCAAHCDRAYAKPAQVDA